MRIMDGELPAKSLSIDEEFIFLLEALRKERSVVCALQNRAGWIAKGERNGNEGNLIGLE